MCVCLSVCVCVRVFCVCFTKCHDCVCIYNIMTYKCSMNGVDCGDAGSGCDWSCWEGWISDNGIIEVVDV